MNPPTIICLGTWGALLGLLWAESQRARRYIYLFKPLASCGFVSYALALGALQAGYGAWVLTALVLCWVGDILLMLPNEKAFVAGLGMFLCGHAAFVKAFLLRGALPGQLTLFSGAIIGILAACGLCIAIWLKPHTPTRLRVPVIAYIVVISTMVCAAAHASRWSAGSYKTIVGAGLFYLSDVCVARDRFVAPHVHNAYVGLPLYYGAQLLLASTVAS